MHRVCVSRRVFMSHIKQMVRLSSSVDNDRLSYLARHGYWEEHYTSVSGRKFDWLLPTSVVLEHVRPLLPTTTASRCLDLGCGTSSLGTDLIQSTNLPLQVFALDYSQAALRTLQSHACDERMKFLHKDSRLFLVAADATQLPFPSDTFDIILDKGTTDSLCKLESRLERMVVVEKLLAECYRTLSPDGALVQVTDEDPELRIPLVEDLSGVGKKDIRISYKIIQDTKDQEYFIYTIKIKS